MVLDNETLGISLSALIGQQAASLVSVNSSPPTVQTHLQGLTGALAQSLMGGSAGSQLNGRKSSTGHRNKGCVCVNSHNNS